MTRTKRFYNFPNNINDFYHPFLVFCCGNCRKCKKWKPDITKKKRIQRRLAEIEIEQIFRPK